jgi:hypothetical protein
MFSSVLQCSPFTAEVYDTEISEIPHRIPFHWRKRVEEQVGKEKVHRNAGSDKTTTK